MRTLKNFLEVEVPKCEFLLCRSIQSDTHQSIDDMGRSIADEIEQCVQERFLKVAKLRYNSNTY